MKTLLDHEDAAQYLGGALEAHLSDCEVTLVPPVESLSEYGYGLEVTLPNGQVAQVSVWLQGEEED